jgi:predicted metalloprotease with PDZ domain
MSIQYRLSSPNPASHYISIEMSISDINEPEIFLQLPSWRPGRYELGNFAKNIRGLKVVDQKNEPLAFKKVSKDRWQVFAENAGTITVKYEYYSYQLDAGSCWVDEDQVYINPVHCFLYIPDHLHEPVEVSLTLPSNYKIATSLRKKDEHTLFADDYHELADSPLIAGHSLQQNTYSVDGIDFTICFQGDCEPDWKRILPDFTAFTEAQIKMMGDFPVKKYIFLVQCVPHRFYHGVEHLRSTVLAVGPGSQLMTRQLYTDFTGVASHELFHSWNVKTIRPAEMMPYDYTKENYSRLGYVYEGVTTYYGDLFLARCGVYSAEQFFEEIGLRFQKHFDNFGRYNLSVADSSYDTWLDGYNPGAPGRKTSIYDEGCLIAIMLDLIIRKKTGSQKSLDDVMRTLYNDFGKKSRGYTEHDYMSVVENVCGESLADFFLDYVYGTEDYDELLTETLSWAGLSLEIDPSPVYSERVFGFKTIEEDRTKVSAIAPDSVAFKAGLGKDDEIAAVNEIRVEKNLPELLQLFAGQKIVLTIFTPMRKLRDIPMGPGNENYFPKYSIVKKETVTNDQREFFKNWLHHDFNVERSTQTV